MKNLIMFRTSRVVLRLAAVAAAMLVATAASGETQESRYIGIDEIKPGMDAYCLTVFEGTKIEKFPLEVVSVVRNISPGRNAILVRGTDERFKHSGPVAGCSGSPVYINGKMAGALAFGWSFSKDPLYGVTPIAEMLEVGKGSYKGMAASAIMLDHSRPLDLDTAWKASLNPILPGREPMTGATNLPVPLAMSLPQFAVDKLSQTMRPMGFVPVAGGGTGDAAMTPPAELVPGSAIAVPLVSGDISISAVGTVTEVVGDKFYAFGHSMLGYGKMELPVGPAYIHTVVASVQSSFKAGEATGITGTLTRDESAAIYGTLGKAPSMIDMRVTVERFNDTQTRLYNCKVAKNELLTPPLVNAVMNGAAYMKGELPPEHTVRYEATIRAKGLAPINSNNISSDSGMTDVSREVVGVTSILINNPYRKAEIESIDVKVSIGPKSIAGAIRAFDVSRTRLKAGETFDAAAEVYSFRAGAKKYAWRMTVPRDVPVGTYKLTIMGSDSYLKFLLQASPHKFTTNNFDEVMAMIDNVLAVRRDVMYAVLLLPPGGVTIENTVLADLPAGKAIVLADPKRTFKIQPFQHWVEQRIPTDGVVADARSVDITIEEQ
jgi:hypothetical protein